MNRYQCRHKGKEEVRGCTTLYDRVRVVSGWLMSDFEFLDFVCLFEQE